MSAAADDGRANDSETNTVPSDTNAIQKPLDGHRKSRLRIADRLVSSWYAERWAEWGQILENASNAG
jgi:hypothetical protein